MQRFLDQRLALRVEVTGRLVQNQNTRILEDHARDRDTLLFSARESVLPQRPVRRLVTLFAVSHLMFWQRCNSKPRRTVSSSSAQSGERLHFKVPPHLLYRRSRCPSGAGQVDAREPLVPGVGPAFHKPGLFHALDRLCDRRRALAELLGQLPSGSSRPPPTAHSASTAGRDRAPAIQQIVHPPVPQPADLVEQMSQPFWCRILWSLLHAP